MDAGEQDTLRGVGLRTAWGVLSLEGVASSTKWDATASDDGVVTVEFGSPHVTAEQITAKNRLKEKLAAGRVGVSSGKWRFGMLAVQSDYSPLFVSGTAIDSSFEWSGPKRRWVSLDGAIKYRDFEFLGEAVRLDNSAKSVMASVRWRADAVRTWATLNHIGSGYASLHGVVRDPRGRNRGVVAGVRWRATSNTAATLWSELVKTSLKGC